jgi:phytanoyl-CoA hydroxylase
MVAAAPAAPEVKPILSQEDVAFFNREGYYIARGLMSKAECELLINHYGDLHARRAVPGYDFKSMEEANGDMLRVYSRIMHPHRWDALGLKYLLDARTQSVLRALLGEEPVATQSMYYFKPPGAKGQAFHQDNFYLRVRPKTCIASWWALDPTDPDNGGLQICPRTQNLDVLCPKKADLDVSFSTELVAPPEGTQPIPAILAAGDVLFFNGSVVHGSTPNYSKTRWRRSYICHYAPESCHEISEWYFPLLNFEGKVVDRCKAAGGGPCGTEVKGNH